MTISAVLAAANASLTAICLACMAAGYHAIRRGRTTRHRFFMLSAVVASATFLMIFVARYVRYGSTEFNGNGVSRAAYLVLLVTHEALSVPTIPLVLATAALGLLGRRIAHMEIARMTLPIWAWVASSGLVIYVLLYVWPGRP